MGPPHFRTLAASGSMRQLEALQPWGMIVQGCTGLSCTAETPVCRAAVDWPVSAKPKKPKQFQFPKSAAFSAFSVASHSGRQIQVERRARKPLDVPT